MRRLDSLLDGMWLWLRNQIIYGGLFLLYLAAPIALAMRTGSVLVGLLASVPGLIVFMGLPLCSARVRSWVTHVNPPAPIDPRDGVIHGLLRSWRDGSVPSRIGLCRQMPLSPDAHAGLEAMRRERQWHIDEVRRRRLDTPANLDRNQVALDRDIEMRTHVIPIIHIERGTTPDTLLVRLDANPPISSQDILEALEKHGETVFGLPFDTPVAKARSVELVLHLGTRAGWSR